MLSLIHISFCKKSIENGIDVVRIFDALNDPRNMEAAMKYVKEYGGLVEAAISYTKSPVHSEDYFVKLAMQLEKMGADTICIKDMANLLLPYDAYSLVKKLKENVGVPIHLHTHNTTGTVSYTHLGHEHGLRSYDGPAFGARGLRYQLHHQSGSWNQQGASFP